MLDDRFALVTVACLAALAAGSTGCTGREQATGGEPDGSVSAPELFFGLVEPEAFSPPSRVIGEQDAANRYPFTLSLLGDAPGARPRYRECSGVLVASNLVLTAAHCLCTPHRDETTRFDSSECATTAEVSTYDYQPWTGNGVREGRTTTRTGNVMVHPQFQLIIDTQGAVVLSCADLAIVHLEHRVRDIRPVRLAAGDVKAGEVLSVVGYTYFEDFGYDHRRRFSREKVQTPADGERVLFGSMDLASYKGDTGGPCLRETERGPELVGISQRGLGLAPAFTRIAPYREWLEEQIRLANEKP